MSGLAFRETIGDYLLLEEIGRGGMGVVYRAEERALRRIVALKILEPSMLDDATARARFQSEIKSAVAIEHPHVVPVYNAGYEDGFFYLAMRFVSGSDLWRLVHHGGPLPEARVARLVGQVASALFAVHQQGLVHRDVKPQNVLVWNPDHPDEHAFLTDFGIAKAIDETMGLTRAGIIGTRGYMAPEIVFGERVTAACDQFSLGCLAYELLSGELPFGDDLYESDDPLPFPISLRVPNVSQQFRETIERSLLPRPKDRFPDIRAFVMHDAALHEEFERSREITETLQADRSNSEIVTGLHAQQRLSLERIAEIINLERSEVLRLRRRAARRSIVGD